jgi:streptogramin lyase
MPKKPTGPEPTSMIVDRYDPVNLFELVPKLNFRFEPELAHLEVNCSMTTNSSTS